MDHVAIMKKEWGLIPKILSGEKSIESRWYQSKRLPWDRIKAGDKDKKYCILAFLQKPQKIAPFEINKKGFGSQTAWLTIDDINRIKIR